MPVKIADLKKQMMERIDNSNLMDVEKVERYMKNLESFRRMDKKIKKEGESVTTINGSQTFVKAHPLLSERNKINTALLSIERSFGFKKNENDKYSSEDLI